MKDYKTMQQGYYLILINYRQTNHLLSYPIQIIAQHFLFVNTNLNFLNYSKTYPVQDNKYKCDPIKIVLPKIKEALESVSLTVNDIDDILGA